MKRAITFIILGSFFMLGCEKSGTWEDVKTAGRYLNRSIDNLVGKGSESRLLENEGDFYGPGHEDFIPLSDSDLQTQFRATDLAVAQPKYAPGEHGVPLMSQFQTPSDKLASLFKDVHFQTDDHIIRNHEDLQQIHKIAEYMKKHPSLMVCIEGNCDERASAAYNMALGTRRANHVRVLLIKQGIDYNRLYTISYGKEKPIALGHTDSDWAANRRAEFKVVEK